MVRPLHNLPAMPGSTPKTKLEAALAWAGRGYHVFPVAPGGKVPLIEDWPRLATTDPGTVVAWWARHPEANIGCAPGASGHFVVDVDDKAGKAGSVTLLMLEAEHGPLPATMETVTATGGRHLWFKGAGANTVGALGSGLDTRGAGGYVLMPGSTTPAGAYLAANDTAPAPLPAWVAERAARKKHEPRARKDDAPLDAPEDVARARDHLRACVAAGDVAVEGAGGNDRTYKLAQELLDLGVSPDTSLSLLADEWNPHCLPPWDREELGRIVANAGEYRQNDAGVRSITAQAAEFAGVIAAPAAPAKRSRFTPLTEADQNTLPEPQWLIPGWIQHGATAMLYGVPGSYKSFLAVDIALSVAAGVPALGLAYEAKAFPVVYAAGEGSRGIAKRRRPAWREHNNVTGDLPFFLVPDVPLARDPASAAEFMAAIEAGCKDRLPRLIVLDTLSRTMTGLDENSAQDATRAIEMADGLARRYSCAVIVVHHEPKHGAGPRGSGVFLGNMDTILRVERDSSKLVTLSCTKQKDADEPRPLHFTPAPAKDSIVLVRTADAPAFAPHPGTELMSEACGALRILGAHDLASAVSTAILAAQILRDRGEAPEGRDNLARIMKKDPALRVLQVGRNLWAAPQV